MCVLQIQFTCFADLNLLLNRFKLDYLTHVGTLMHFTNAIHAFDRITLCFRHANILVYVSKIEKFTFTP